MFSLRRNVAPNARIDMKVRLYRSLDNHIRRSTTDSIAQSYRMLPTKFLKEGSKMDNWQQAQQLREQFETA